MPIIVHIIYLCHHREIETVRGVPRPENVIHEGYGLRECLELGHIHVELLSREELLAPEVLVHVLEDGQVGFQDVVCALVPDELTPILLGREPMVSLGLDIVHDKHLYCLGFGLGLT